MIVILFVDLQKISLSPKFGGCGSQIEPATPILISNFNGAWQAQFLNHTHVTLGNYVFFIDLQMILLSFFDIPYQKSTNQEKRILSVQSVLPAGQIGQLVGQISQKKSVFLVLWIFG